MKHRQGKRTHRSAASQAGSMVSLDGWGSFINSGETVLAFTQPHVAHGQPEQLGFRLSSVLYVAVDEQHRIRKIPTVKGQPSFLEVAESLLGRFVEGPNLVVRIIDRKSTRLNSSH